MEANLDRFLSIQVAPKSRDRRSRLSEEIKLRERTDEGVCPYRITDNPLGNRW